MWRDYFPRGTIVGLDRNPCRIKDPTGRIVVYKGFQQDTYLLDRIKQETAPDGFDIIIDDASHLGELTRVSFWHLFENHLKEGGLYVIEDWRTGYWDAWIDGNQYKSTFKQRGLRKWFFEKVISREQGSILARQFEKLLYRKRFHSHCYGMVGVIKELVDELGVDAITNPARNELATQRFPKFKKIEITPGQVFVMKRTRKDDELAAEQVKNSSH
ncbi:MAG: class I SAM-dependent methyltransferase [Candidatus Nealsonbacteria bacterium]|nr:MAG: class I SAM-dependent methyltransferase [Candidatus Nealsonbacteria bacterium]